MPSGPAAFLFLKVCMTSVSMSISNGEPYFVRQRRLLIGRLAFIRHSILRVRKCPTLWFLELENVRHCRELGNGKIS